METCKNIPRCPIYNDILKNNEQLVNTYKSLFCEAGENSIKNCKRYQVSQKIGSCPPNISPNSRLSVDEIVAMASN